MNVILAGWKELDWDAPRLTEEVQPDYVVLTLPVGKTHQENPSRNKKTPQENTTRKQPKKTIQKRIEARADNRFLFGTKEFF